MHTEIKTLVDHPETLHEILKLKQLDGLIRKVTTVWGQTITMRYRVSEGRSEARFDAESEQDLVGSSGIFAKVLTKCKIDTFNSCLTYTPNGGYKIWFTLHLSYQHFNGGSNGMGIASFWFENGKWTMSDYKDENEEK